MRQSFYILTVDFLIRGTAVENTHNTQCVENIIKSTGALFRYYSRHKREREYDEDESNRID